MRASLAFLFGLALAGSPSTWAQPLDLHKPDKLSIGAAAGFFRISYDDFVEYYKGRSGFAWGVHASYRVATPYNVVLKYRTYNRTAEYLSGSESVNLEWRENWINVGVRYMGTDREHITSFFSFGFSFFDISERGGISVFGGSVAENGEKKTSAGGFFIDLGLNYPLSRRLAIIFDFEITSAGVKGKSGFEGSSVGGFFFGLGIAGFLF